MKELIQEFIIWAKTDDKYPLLFPLITPGIFLFVQNYSNTQSFAETLHHEAFLISSGSIVLISGLLFFLLQRKNRARLLAGCTIAFFGLVAIAYGIYILIPCKITPDSLVVAVVEFEPAGDDAENDAIKIRDAFCARLQNSEKQGVPIIVKKLNKRISFESTEQGNAAAKKIGNHRRGCAHLVIWGSVRRAGTNNDDIWIVPNVTVAQHMPNVVIAESQFEELHDDNLGNFYEITSLEITNIVKYIGGVAYYKLGKWKKAIKLLEEVKLYEAMIMRGMSNLMIGDLVKSLESFEDAAKLQPKKISSYNSLGMVHLQMGNYEKSKLYFTKAIEIDPDNFASRNNLAITNLKLGDYKSAEKNFKIALKLKNHPTVHSNLAFCHFEQNQITEAIQHWETSLRLFAQWPLYPGIELDVTDANAGLALGNFAKGNLVKAIDLYEKAVNDNPDYFDIEKLEKDYLWPPKAKLIADELLKKINSNIQK